MSATSRDIFTQCDDNAVERIRDSWMHSQCPALSELSELSDFPRAYVSCQPSDNPLPGWKKGDTEFCRLQWN